MLPYIHLFRHWEKIFWLLFAAMGLSLVTGMLVHAVSFEFFVILGLIVVIIGAGKLAQELANLKVLGYQNDIYKKLTSISQQLEKTYNMASRHKKRTDYRVHKLDNRRIGTDIKIEKRYRELVSKIIEVENRVNKLSNEMKK